MFEFEYALVLELSKQEEVFHGFGEVALVFMELVVELLVERLLEQTAASSGVLFCLHGAILFSKTDLW